MLFNPYLYFNGQCDCEEAFEFYEKSLGGKITFVRESTCSGKATTRSPTNTK